MSGTSETATQQDDEFDEVDLPMTVPPEMAEDIRDDLESKGRAVITISTDQAPKVLEQIDWQLENETNALEFVEEYDAE